MTALPEQNYKASLKNFLIPLGVILAFVWLGLLGLKARFNNSTAERAKTSEVRVGSVLPLFSFATAGDGRSVSISEFSSKVVVLNFWATWCEACMEELPSLIQLRKRFQGAGLEVIGVNLDENPDRSIEKTKQQYKIEFPLVKDVDGKLADLFDVHAIPVTLVFDKNRKVLLIKEGGQDWFSKEIVGRVQQWLSP